MQAWLIPSTFRTCSASRDERSRQNHNHHNHHNRVLVRRRTLLLHTLREELVETPPAPATLQMALAAARHHSRDVGPEPHHAQRSQRTARATRKEENEMHFATGHTTPPPRQVLPIDAWCGGGWRACSWVQVGLTRHAGGVDDFTRQWCRLCRWWWTSWRTSSCSSTPCCLTSSRIILDQIPQCSSLFARGSAAGGTVGGSADCRVSVPSSRFSPRTESCTAFCRAER